MFIYIHAYVYRKLCTGCALVCLATAPDGAADGEAALAPPASRHGSSNSVFQMALSLPSYSRNDTDCRPRGLIRCEMS